MNYPSHLVQQNDNDLATVNALQAALKAAGYGPLNAGVFDAQMSSVVKLYQSQHVDREGRALDADGVIGPMTWATLFGDTTAPAARNNAVSPLAQKAIEIARAQVGVMEEPPGSNSGPKVNQYLLRVGIDPAHTTAEQRYWCMAFVYWCVDEAAKALNTANPLVHTASVLDQWHRCAGRPNLRLISQHDALTGTVAVEPGHILILDHGGGMGHTGLVSAVDGPHLTVIEGNANALANSRNGLGVFQTTHRKISDKEVAGFIDY